MSAVRGCAGGSEKSARFLKKSLLPYLNMYILIHVRRSSDDTERENSGDSGGVEKARLE
jgi:hypothetical protein